MFDECDSARVSVHAQRHVGHGGVCLELSLFFLLFPVILAQGPRQGGDIQQTFWIRLAYVVPA